MNAILTIAMVAFTEARRNRVTLVVAAFALTMLLSTSIMLSVTIFTLDRVATDFGLGLMSLLLVGLAVFLSSGQLSREIDRRTIFLVLFRPVSRAQFVIGRVIGTVATLWTLLAAMCLVFLAQLFTLHINVTEAQIAAIIGLMFELMLIATIGVLFSSFSGPLVSSLATVGIYLAGHTTADLYAIAMRSKSDALKIIGQILYWIMPQLDRVDFKLQAAYEQPINWSQCALACGYISIYTTLGLTLAIIGFNRVDFK
jgi:Cu-processing system permease protein